jgi:integrase
MTTEQGEHAVQAPALEAELLPPLEGRAGTLTGAEDDWAAARHFLNEYRASPETLRRYAAEIGRLFLWAERCLSKSPSQLTRSDYDAYERFLADPQPSALWCGPVRPRGAPDWRPFVRGLSPASVRHALSILQSMLAYWVADGYLKGNPLALKRLKGGAAARYHPAEAAPGDGHFERFFDASLREALVAEIEALPRETRRQAAAYRRARWLYWLLCSTGCRIGELAGACHGDFIEREEGWWLQVLGKGRKPRRVPISGRLMRELGAFRQCHGLAPYPRPDDVTPLLPPLYLRDGRGRARPGLKPRQVNRLLKDLAERAATRLEAESPARAERLRRASAHWFRHTLVTALIEQDIPIKSIMKTTGHADERTFRRYNQRLREDQHQDVTRIFDETEPQA